MAEEPRNIFYTIFLITLILVAPVFAGVILPGNHGAQCSSDADCNAGLCCVTGAAELQYNNQCHRTYNKHGGQCMSETGQNQFAYMPDTEPSGCKVRVTFQWITAPGTTAQYLEINSVNDFSSCGTGICKRVDVTGKNPYTMDTGLTPNNQYYWRIVADVNGARKSSAVASFISPECSSNQCLAGSCINQNTPRPTCTQKYGTGYSCKLGEACTGTAQNAAGTNCEGAYSGDEVCCKPAAPTTTLKPSCEQKYGASYSCKKFQLCTGSFQDTVGTTCDGVWGGDEICCGPVVPTTLAPRTTTIPLCTSNTDCNDGRPCTRGICKGSDIGCIYENLPAGQSCGIGKICNGDGHCIDQSTPEPSCADTYGIGYSCKKFQLCNEEIKDAAGTNCDGTWGGDEVCCGPSTSPGCKQLYLDKTSSNLVPSYIMSGKKYTLYCDFGERVDCISPSGACRWVGWTGTAATYECDAPIAPDNYDIYCGTYATASNCCSLPQTDAYKAGTLHVSGSCVFNTDCPSDNNPCTSNVCKKELELCIYPNKARGTSCGNGGTCDGIGHCTGETTPTTTPQQPSCTPGTNCPTLCGNNYPFYCPDSNGVFNAVGDCWDVSICGSTGANCPSNHNGQQGAVTCKTTQPSCWSPTGWYGGSMNNLAEGTGISVQSGGSYTMTCNYGAQVACIHPSIQGCAFTGWAGDQAAKFSCTAPTAPGSYDIYCTTGTGTPSNCCGGQSNMIGTLTVLGTQTTITTTTTTIIVSKPLLCGDYGDVDDDNAITSKDQLAVLQKSVGITPNPFIANRADVDKDNDIDGADALKIGRYLSGTDTFFAMCPRPQCSNYGDVNNDGYVTYIDALFIAQRVAGLNPSPFYTDRADVDGNGKVESTDSTFVQRYSAGTGSLPRCGSAATTTTSSTTSSTTTIKSITTSTTTSTSTTIAGQLRPPCGNYGDVDGDGDVDSVDSLWVQQKVAGTRTLAPDQAERADVDNDGDVDSVDSLKILRYVAKLDPKFPVCG